MRRILFLLPALVAVMISCADKQYEECPSDRIVDAWGVTNSTHAFGEYDSLYYIINPLGNVMDSLYYNGNYTDSYYHSDSTRVMLKYTTQDSIIFRIDRMYAVEINPTLLVMTVKAEKDTTDLKCTLLLKKDSNSDNIYTCGPDSLFKRILQSEGKIRFYATNSNSSAEPQGSQNYDFFIYAAGFQKALNMADSLNNPGKFPKNDSINKKEERKDKDRKGDNKENKSHEKGKKKYL